MDIDVPAGKYVLAISGGVDSVVLLDLLAAQGSGPDTPHPAPQANARQRPSKSKMQEMDRPLPDVRLVVAHFDHGIRPDSAEDRKLVEQLAQDYSLPFVYERAELGKGVSEAAAREARYRFLRQVCKNTGAGAIITAHHQDDVLETIVINWLRGTRSRGLSSLRSGEEIRRPLLGMSKKQIRVYAHLHKLRWREDSTNSDETYLRNYIRRRIIPRLDDSARQRLLAHSAEAARLNDAVRELTAGYLNVHTTSTSIEREPYRSLPEEVSREVLAEWLRCNVPVGMSTKLIDRLDAALRQGRNNSRVDIARSFSLRLGRSQAVLDTPKQLPQI